MSKTQVADIDRSIYDFTKSEAGYERYADGLTLTSASKRSRPTKGSSCRKIGAQT